MGIQLADAIEQSMGDSTLEFSADGEPVTAENTTEAGEPTSQPEDIDQDKEVEEEAKEDTKDKGAEEPFSKVDPNSLAPELQAIYKSMQADYTRKQQEVAKIRKELESRAVENKPTEEAKPDTQPQQEVDFDKMTPQEYAKWVQDQAVKAVRDEKEEGIKRSAQSEYNNLDPRLNSTDTESYDPVVDDYVASRLDKLASEHIEKFGTFEGFDYKGKGRGILTEWDNYLKKNFGSFLDRQKTVAKEAGARTLPKNPTTSRARTVSTGKVSIDTALEEALAKHGGDGF